MKALRELIFLILSLVIVYLMGEFGDPVLQEFINMKLGKAVAVYLMACALGPLAHRIMFHYFRPHDQTNGDMKWAVFSRLFLTALFAWIMVYG